MSPLRPGLSYLSAFERRRAKRRPRRRLSFTHVAPFVRPVVTIRFVGPTTDPDVLALQRWSVTSLLRRVGFPFPEDTTHAP